MCREVCIGRMGGEMMAETLEEVVPVDDEWLTVQEVATYLRMNPATIRKWLREGRLRGISFGGPAGWRIRREELERFIREQENREQQ
jgi:excisionase family DNA binding protein